MRTSLIVTLLLLAGCAAQQQKERGPVGYLGFTGNQLWAIRFNDCTVYNPEQAAKYLWFNRKLDKISCYLYSGGDLARLEGSMDKVYSSPDLSASFVPFSSFSELTVSESGWGEFPLVYETQNNWFKIKEGWIQLTPTDLNFVQFYPGRQGESQKQAHEEYYRRH